MMASLSHSPAQIFTLMCSFGAALAFCGNALFYRRPQGNGAVSLPPVSVLIPARNEEQGIAAAVRSVLSSTGAALEVVVLDDASTDRTAEVVESIAAEDGRVRVVSKTGLPAGWNGKQFACHQLAGEAAHEWLCFMDADVRMAPDALRAMLAHAEQHRMDLLSGFPLQETGTWLEKLLIPLIHLVLLCYLPVPFLRKYPTVPALAAGCGQIMLVRAAAYAASGGHAAIRATMHDGLLLPRLLREHGFRTDLVDLTHLLRCRMYSNAREVWFGLGKNATEGMAAPARIVPFTLLLLFAQVVPVCWLAVALLRGDAWLWPLLATLSGYAVRVIAMVRFRQSLLGVLLHPLAVLLSLVLQWWALGRRVLGIQATWKQRVYDAG